MRHSAVPDAPSSRVLVRGVNWLGDAIMSMPALERLREARPKDHITLLTSQKTAALWQNHPAVDEVLAFAESDTLFSIARLLREGKFDLALILPNSPRSALESFLARIPQRIGYARPWRNLFLTHRVRPRPEAVLIRPRTPGEIRSAMQRNVALPAAFPPKSHHLYDYLHLVASVGANPAPLPPRVVVTQGEMERARSLLKAERPPGGWFGLNAGAEYGPAKRWPTARFIEAAVEVHRQIGCGWIVFGGKQDVALAEEIERAIRRDSAAPVVNLAGKTNLRELCAALKLCRVVLTNDTGPMHMAAAVGTRVVVPFGSTSAELTGPGLPGAGQHLVLQANVVCRPCFRRECPVDFRCMENIGVQQVVAAVLRAA